MKTRFIRAFQYEMKNYFRAVAVLWLVMALLPAAMLALAYFLAGETAMESSFNGYSMAVGMFGLILGMVGLRENQRVLNQNGVSRRSAFLADMAALAVAAVLVAVGVSVIMGAYQVVLGGEGRLLITDLYQLIYEPSSNGVNPGALVRGAAFSAVAGWMLAALGQFCSALFWRLNKFWIIAVSVGALLLLLGLNWRLLVPLAILGTIVSSSPWAAMAVFLISGAAFFALAWLLVRRVMIRPAK